MVQTGQYDVLEFSMPVEGMNQNISPDILPPSFAFLLENIIAKPLGEGQVRFGTEESLSLPNPEATIIRQFPYLKPDGGMQILLYVQEYGHDAEARDFKVRSPFCFSFDSLVNAIRYVRDTAIKVEYAMNGHTALYDAIASLTVTGKSVTVTLAQNAFPDGAVITGVSFSTGSIYCYDLGSRTLSRALKENLCVACIPRYTTYLGKLLICNGVDKVLSWDGRTLEEVYDFVEECPSNATDFTLSDYKPSGMRQFSFAVPPNFDLNNYARGNKLKITANGITAETTIADRSLHNGILTVTTATGLPDFIQDFTLGSDPLLLGDLPFPSALDNIQGRQFALFCKKGKLYGKVWGKDRIEIKVDKNTASYTAQGLSLTIFKRIMNTVIAQDGDYKIRQESETLRAQIHAEVEQVLGRFLYNMEAYYRDTRIKHSTATISPTEAPQKKEGGKEPPATKDREAAEPELAELSTGETMTPEDGEALRSYIILCGYMDNKGQNLDKPPGEGLDFQLFYQAWPPKFNFLFVAHDRLWALGEGASGLEYRTPSEALRVYYANSPNTVTGWFNPLTKTVPSLDLSAKHGEPDNLEAICLIGNCLAFMGRKKTQVYQGQSPLPPSEGGDFAYLSILPTGIIHGDLLVELANDVFFISPTGMQSFSTLNVAKQFAATSLDAVDPLIQQYAASLTQSNINYRACQSFKYEAGTLVGFKIGNNKVLCSLFSTALHSWSVFSGDFEAATSFLTFGNGLYLSSRNKVYRYADGHDGNPPCYGDQGGSGVDSQLIPFSWTLPVIADSKGRRFANKRYEIQLDYPSGFALRPQNQVNIGISGDLPKSYAVNSPCRFELRGDLLQSIPLAHPLASSEDSLGFRFEQPFSFFKDRLKFMASRFWLTLNGYTKDGPLTFKKIKLYGIIERR